MDAQERQEAIALARFCYKPIIKTLRVASNLCYTTALVDYGTVTGFLMLPCGWIGHNVTDGIATSFAKDIGRRYGRTPEEAVARVNQAREILVQQKIKGMRAAYQNIFHKNSSGQRQSGMVVWEGVEHPTTEISNDAESNWKNSIPEFAR